MKKMWKIRRKTEAVSPVIATILMVAITVVLAAVLYVMVMGFSTGGNTPTAALNYQQTASGNYTVTLVSISQNNVNNSSVTIVVTPTLAAGNIYGFITAATVSHYLGAGDYLTLKNLVVGTTYTITVKYNPTGNAIASKSITASY